MNSVNLLVQNYVSSVRTESLTNLMLFVSSIFNFSTLFFIVIILISILIYIFKSHRDHLKLFLVSTLTTPFIVYLLKYWFNVSRPTNPVIDAFGQSFPSYHTTEATVLFVILMYIFDDYFKSFGRIVFNSLCTLFVFTVAFSRIYLGVHWFSDVFVGVLLGAFISYMSIKIFKYVRNVQVLRL